MLARLLSVAVVAVGLGRTAAAQEPPAVHPLGAIVAKTAEPIGRLEGIHVLSTGRVVVNDAAGRRLLLFDSTLATFTVLLDTGTAAARKYPDGDGSVLGSVVPFLGDSTVFYDAVAVALVILDPNGRIARIMAPPFPPDAGYLTLPGTRFDPGQRLLYRASLSTRNRPTVQGAFPISDDSAPIVRARAGAGAPDTVAYVRMPKLSARESYMAKEGVTVQRVIVNPFLLLDEWSVLPDGTVAIVRGQDYHLDFIAPNGARSSSPKLPFRWHRLSDSDKVAIIDSIKAHNAANPVPIRARSPDGQAVTGTYPLGVISPDSLADYRPPFGRGAMLADAQGNVWILPTPEVPLSPNPGPVYDVVNREGTLVDRVQLSPGFGIVGFSPGYVFMSIRDGATTVLVKAKIR